MDFVLVGRRTIPAAEAQSDGVIWMLALWLSAHSMTVATLMWQSWSKRSLVRLPLPSTLFVRLEFSAIVRSDCISAVWGPQSFAGGGPPTVGRHLSAAPGSPCGLAPDATVAVAGYSLRGMSIHVIRPDCNLMMAPVEKCRQKIKLVLMNFIRFVIQFK